MAIYEKGTDGDFDKLIGGVEQSLIAVEITLDQTAGACVRGQLLGQITTSGTYAKCDSTNNDGTEVAVAILGEDADATDGDIVTAAYKSGEFNETEVVFEGSDDADTHRDALAKIGIILRPAVEI